ncbi:hypothetical protein ACFLWU_01765 [Chloroflexota bacterium]
MSQTQAAVQGLTGEAQRIKVEVKFGKNYLAEMMKEAALHRTVPEL